MNDLAQRVVAGHIRQEGAPADSCNPGNLRAAPWLPNPIILDGFWHPSSRAIGEAGLLHIVSLNIARGLTLTEHVMRFAPAADHNNIAAYIRNMKEWCSIPDENVPLWAYLG